MPALRLREVVKHYRTSGGEDIPAVDRVSLEVCGGEFVGICGPSGAGKTTLLLLAAAIKRADDGAITFDERDLSGFSASERTLYLRRDVGLVRQALPARGVPAINQVCQKLIADGYSPKEARKLAAPWLDRVGLAHRAGHTPKQLSMGERQRVAIAQALVNEPGMILADEPTGNLDSTRSADILRLLREICHERQIPVILVTHDVMAEGHVDRFHTLMDGRLHDGVAAGMLSAK